MNIEYVGRHVAVDDRIRELTEEKIDRLAKFLGEPVDVHVVLESEKFRQIAEVRVTQKRSELLAREEGTDLLEALRTALDTIDAQARRTREKTVDRRRRVARAATPSSAGAAAGGAEGR